MIFTSYSNIISPLGFSTQANYAAVCQSKIAVKKTVLPFSTNAFCVAQINSEEIDERFFKLKQKKTYTKLEKLSILSIQDVLNKSGINPRDKRTLLIYSTTKGNIDLLANDFANDVSTKRVYLPVFVNELKEYFHFSNTPVILSNACVSGILAIVVAKRFIQQGMYDNVVVCGGDILSEFTISGFKSFNALSNEFSKPFDAGRDGINLGEAVSSILITNKKELSSIYDTQIVSGYSANDANHISGPSRTGEGLYKCLKQLNISATESIGFISAHGTATVFNDEMESIAFDRAELNTIPVNSLKGYYGHTLGAAGVLETILSLESLKHQQLIKSEGYNNKGFSGNVSIITAHQPKSFSSFIKTASGFGGCNTAALFSKI